MATNANPSSSGDDSSGTDLCAILTEDEEQIDTTNWPTSKMQEITTHDRIP